MYKRQQLLNGTEPEYDFTGFETSDFCETVKKAVEEVNENDIEQWLNLDEGDPGYQILSQEEIVESVLHDDQEDGDDEDEETSVTGGSKLSAIRNSMDEIIAHIGELSLIHI